ncbi:MAG: RAMP superfamily CRISPR-associated protein [Promethearchaeota archaeon]
MNSVNEHENIMNINYFEPIKIQLILENLRIGGLKRISELNLPLAVENGSYITTNIVSSFKGALRRSCYEIGLYIVNNFSKGQFLNILEAEESLFGGSHLDNRSIKRAGKLEIFLDEFKLCSNERDVIYDTVKENNELKSNIRYGIRIEPIFGAVESKALYSYEYLEGLFCLNIIINLIVPINIEEIILLYLGINNLINKNIGSFRSKGFGLIKEVKIDDAFMTIFHQIFPEFKQKLLG